MKLVDANVLIYAVNTSARHHEASRRWLDRSLNGGETVLLPWLSLLAFTRLVTNPRVFDNPLSSHQALSRVRAWTHAPAARIPHPDGLHASRLEELLATIGTGGNLVNDAHLAALSIQFDAEITTFDNDFGRFPGVRWAVPAD